MKRYIAITPARDEEKFLPGLIDSMARQTCLPERWIIIDDASTDSTAEIIDSAAKIYSWIEPDHLEQRTKRAAGGGESSTVATRIMHFLTGNAFERDQFILRADADVSFGPDFAALLLAEFKQDPKLGIAGPLLFEPSRSGLRQWREPRFQAPGPPKMYSSACFAAIGGLKSGLGWDTIDNTCALMLGFRTSKFPHIRALHRRPQGTASGAWRNRLSQGYAAYFAGYSPLYMLARAVLHSFIYPPIGGGALMFAGYCRGYLHRWPRPASPELIRFVRRQQLRRLLLMETLWR